MEKTDKEIISARQLRLRRIDGKIVHGKLENCKLPTPRTLGVGR